MFSFVDDTVLDPFVGTGTTMIAAVKAGRNSIGLDIDPDYCRMAARRLRIETSNMFNNAHSFFQKSVIQKNGLVTLYEEKGNYSKDS